MRFKFKTILFFIMIFSLSFSENTNTNTNIYNSNENTNEQTSIPSDYKSILLGDMDGNIYKQENIYDVRPLASMTKVMTVLLTLERIKNNEIAMDTPVTISEYASKVPYGIKLVAGKQYTVKDLLKATIIRSSNNAAEALGEFNGNGDVSTFVDKMNQKANELGLTTLRYCTPHGLPPEDTQGKCRDQGSAADLYKLAQTIIKYDEYLDISRNSSDYIDNGNIKLTSTNHLLDNVEGVDGLKTGYYKAAGSNIILTAKRNNKRIILIIMGSEKAKNRDLIGKVLINNFYELHHEIKVVDSSIPIGSIKLKGSQYNLYPEKDILMDNEVSKSLIKGNTTYIFNISNNINSAKVEDIVGTYTAKYDGKEFTGNLVLK